MSVNSDSAHEEIDAAVAGDLLLVSCALAFRVISHAVEDVYVRRIHVHEVVEEIIMHEIPVTLVMLMRKTEIFIHVECNDILERELAGLVLCYKVLIYTDRRGSRRQSKHERSVFFMRIDLISDVISCPFTHLVIIVLNYYSHVFSFQLSAYIVSANAF